MTGPEITITGGGDGVGANVEAMRATAQQLSIATDTLGGIAGRARDDATSGALLRTVIFSPGSAAYAEGALLQAAGSATGLVLRLDAQVLLLRSRADLFELADAGGDLVTDVGQTILAPFVLGGIITTSIQAGLAGGLLSTPAAIGDILSGDADPGEALDMILAGATGGAKDNAMTLLSRFPGATDTITGGLPRFLQLLSIAAPGPGKPLPGDLQGLIRMLQGPLASHGYGLDRHVTVGPERRKGLVEPQSLQSILRSVAEMEGRFGPEKAGEASRGSGVTIKQIPGDPPRWIVEIPGTTSWDPVTGKDPADLTSNGQLMNRRGAQLAALRDAMKAAGIGPDDPVLVAGHSQGGIAAAALASDAEARTRYNITNVLTAGSPIADMPIPRDVNVISIEHEQDPVPRLEGDDNPDRPNWTTVHRDVGDVEGVSSNPIAAHNGSLYAETAGAIPDRNQQSFDPFLGESGTQSSEFPMHRDPPR